MSGHYGAGSSIVVKVVQIAGSDGLLTGTRTKNCLGRETSLFILWVEVDFNKKRLRRWSSALDK